MSELKEFKFEYNAQWASGGQETEPKKETMIVEAVSLDEAIKEFKKILYASMFARTENCFTNFKVYFDEECHSLCSRLRDIY